MSSGPSQVVATLAGESLTVAEFLGSLHRRRRLRALVREAALEKHLLGLARARGLEVQPEDLQREADRFRQQQGLNALDDLQNWLTQEGLSVEQFEEGLECQLLVRKLCEHVIGAKLQAQAASQRGQVARVRLSHIVVDKESVANELLQRLRTRSADFAELARRFSLHEPTRANGGALGIVRRSELDPALHGPVFSARAGDVIGPIVTALGVELVKVEEHLPGSVEESAGPALNQELFGAWLEDLLKQLCFEFLPPATGVAS